jgi:hypothetical protein
LLISSYTSSHILTSFQHLHILSTSSHLVNIFTSCQHLHILSTSSHLVNIFTSCQPLHILSISFDTSEHPHSCQYLHIFSKLHISILSRYCHYHIGLIYPAYIITILVSSVFQSIPYISSPHQLNLISRFYRDISSLSRRQSHPPSSRRLRPKAVYPTVYAASYYIFHYLHII